MVNAWFKVRIPGHLTRIPMDLRVSQPRHHDPWHAQCMVSWRWSPAYRRSSAAVRCNLPCPRSSENHDEDQDEDQDQDHDHDDDDDDDGDDGDDDDDDDDEVMGYQHSNHASPACGGSFTGTGTRSCTTTSSWPLWSKRMPMALLIDCYCLSLFVIFCDCLLLCIIIYYCWAAWFIIYHSLMHMFGQSPFNQQRT